METVTTIKPGRYALVPLEWDDTPHPQFVRNYKAVANEGAVEEYESIHHLSDEGIGMIDGRLAVHIAFEDEPIDDIVSINTANGPLTLVADYLLIETDDTDVNQDPAEQYALNWVVLDIAEPTDIEIDAKRLQIGKFVLDLTRGLDFRCGDRIIRDGTPLSMILETRKAEIDDGVLGLLPFKPDQMEGVRDLAKESNITARAVLAEMEAQVAAGRGHIVLSIQVDQGK